MSDAVSIIGLVLTALGALFFLAGTVGMVRFPDALTRLHALAKADNLGLGFVVVGLAVQAGSAAVALKLLIVWGLALVAGATSAFLIADVVRRGGRSDG
ncbi:MAG: monovalent cation/H(+) antiporter subunit G [Miltoncostaeaceae bacterium]